MFLNSKLILSPRWPTSRTSASLSSPRLRRLGFKSMSAWARLWSVRGSKGSEDLYVCLQVTRDLFDRVLEGSTFKIGPNPKIFLRRVFPVQVWPERFFLCVKICHLFCLHLTRTVKLILWYPSSVFCTQAEISEQQMPLIVSELKVRVLIWFLRLPISKSFKWQIWLFCLAGWRLPHPHQRLPRSCHPGESKDYSTQDRLRK